MLETEIQNVGRNNDSVGCVRQPMKVWGNMMKRAMSRKQNRMKRTMSRTHTMSPRTWSPSNRCGVCESNRAIPPVAIVHVNHASVK